MTGNLIGLLLIVAGGVAVYLGVTGHYSAVAKALAKQ